MRLFRSVLASLVLATPLLAAAPAFAAPATFRIDAGACAAGPASGRLLIFAEPLKGDLPKAVDSSPFNLKASSVAAQEVYGLIPGKPVTIDADVTAFPAPLSTLTPGRYAVQAVLDQEHTYNYTSRGAGNCVSPVVAIDLPISDAAPVLTLAAALPAMDPWTPYPQAGAEIRQAYVDARPFVQELAFTSPALSRFWGKPTAVTGWIVLPPGYDPKSPTRYPTVYQTHGFGGTHYGQLASGISVWREMKAGLSPPMIWVFLDESFASGTHEFYDSVNNGPWGEALTVEVIPDLERRFHMDARPSGRFVTGHSSGGWAALWLQVRYPALFGGAWPTSPDPSDFHNWTGVDIYAPGANVYRAADGSAAPLFRDQGKVLASLQDLTRLEVVLGDYGGQESSLDWTFSPRGQDGRPMPMFDRATGRIDPMVLAYWRDHADVAERLRRHWPELRKDLDGKLHITVGTADSFYLDGSARLLEATMKGLGAKTDFRYLDGKTHFDLYAKGDDRQALRKSIASEIYAVARPGSKPPVASPTN